MSLPFIGASNTLGCQMFLVDHTILSNLHEFLLWQESAMCNIFNVSSQGLQLLIECHFFYDSKLFVCHKCTFTVLRCT